MQNFINSLIGQSIKPDLIDKNTINSYIQQAQQQNVESPPSLRSSVPLSGASDSTIINNILDGINNFKSGFHENYTTPYSVSNAAPNENKTFGNRFGEAVGTMSKWAESPLGRGLITGALVGMDGGSPMDSLSYGLGATVKNQSMKTSDKLYRMRLQDLGYDENYINNLPGYINDTSYKNISDSVYKQQLADINSLYRLGMLGVNQQKADTDSDYKKGQIDFKNSQNFVTNNEYYKRQLENGEIDENTYNAIITHPNYDPDSLVNLNAIKAVASQTGANTRAKKAADDIKTAKQKRYYASKNGGKNVIKVEYGEKPNSNSTVDVFYHDKPGYGNTKQTVTSSFNPQKTQSKPTKTKTEYQSVYDKFLPLSKGKKYAF